MRTVSAGALLLELRIMEQYVSECYIGRVFCHSDQAGTAFGEEGCG